jgi:hypothetical protein
VSRPTGKGHAGAYDRGAKARREGKPRSACPYRGDRLGGANRNVVTGARGYASAWQRGWDEAAPAELLPGEKVDLSGMKRDPVTGTWSDEKARVLTGQVRRQPDGSRWRVSLVTDQDRVELSGPLPCRSLEDWPLAEVATWELEPEAPRLGAKAAKARKHAWGDATRGTRVGETGFTVEGCSRPGCQVRRRRLHATNVEEWSSDGGMSWTLVRPNDPCRGAS